MNSTIDDLQCIRQLTTIGLLFTRYSLMILAVLGLVGNLLNVFVFRQRQLRSNPCSFYFLSAAIVNLIWHFADVWVQMLSTFGLDLSQHIGAIFKIREFVVYTLQSLSTLFIGLATLGRFLISSKKIEYRRMSSLRNARQLVAISTIIYCLIYVDLFYCLDVTGTPPQLACTTGTTRACGLYNEIARLVVLLFIPCMLRIYLVATLDTPESPLQSRIEALWGQVILVVAVMESSLSFYIYAIFGGTLFRQTLKTLLRHVVQYINNRVE